jgi:hypothetical protein
MRMVFWMLLRVVWQKFNDLSDKGTAAIFRVEE